MRDTIKGALGFAFPDARDEAEHPFKKAGQLLDGINALRVLMYKQQGIDFTPPKYTDNAHGYSENGFNYKLGFKQSGHEQDPVFDMISSLKTFSFSYVRSDDTVKHPYPHEIFVNQEELDDLLMLVANKISDVERMLDAKAPKPYPV
jgi:hypothetical protein